MALKSEMLKIVDLCLARMAGGEPLEKCLADYPQHRNELEPLLKTAAIIASVPKVSPSAEFHRLSQARLIDLLRQETNSKGKAPIRRWDWHSLLNNQFLRPLVPAGLVLLVVAVVALSYFVDKGNNIEAADVTLSILGGSTEVQTSGASNWQSGVDGLVLGAGSRVKTAADSYAMLTFVDGSTIKLEPGTEIGVSTSEFTDRVSTKIVLQQTVGKTWSHIQPTSSNAADFSIQTPSSIISAHGTSFATDVDPAGVTKVAAVEGTVEVFAQNQAVSLAMQQTQIEPGAAPQPPEPLAAIGNELVVTTDLAAVSTICDPSGASTGYLPNGLAINQITGSQNTLSAGGQQIKVDQPAPGEYAIIVRSLNQQAVEVNIQLKSPGQEPFLYNEILSGSGDGVWLIRIAIDQGSSAPKVAAVEPLGDKKIEHVVETKLALERAVPFTVSAAPTSNTSSVPAITSPTSVPPPYSISPETVPSPTAVVSTPAASPVLIPTDIPTTPQATIIVTPGVTDKPTDTPKPTIAPTAIINTGVVVTPTPKPTPTVTPKPTAATISPTPTATPKPTAVTIKPTTTPASAGAVNPGNSNNGLASTAK